MRKTVRRRHNKDGSVTTTTSYSRKNIFGTRVVDAYVSKSSAPGRVKYSASAPKAYEDPKKRQERLQKELRRKYERILCKSAFYCFAISFGIAFVIPSFMLLNVLADVYDFSTFINHWISYLKVAAVIIFPCMVIGTASQFIYVRRRRIWLEENSNTEQKTAFAEKEPYPTDENQVSVVTQRAKNFLEHENKSTEQKTVNEQAHENTDNDLMNIIKKVAKSVDISVLLKDDDVRQAAVYVVDTGKATTAHIMTNVGVGFSRAVRILSVLEEIGIIGPLEGTAPRRILVDREWLNQQLESCVLENKEWVEQQLNTTSTK